MSDRIGRLRAFAAGIVAPGRPYALVDFPEHPNVGDSAIWLGELALLDAAAGAGPAYVSTWEDFDAAAMRAAIGDGRLLIHGGGNLGDIWPHHQRFRETLLETVRDRPVVQLPQSIHFRDPANAARFVAAANAHPDFRLAVRDRASLAFARERLRGGATLLPDAAIALGPQARGPAEREVLLLLRTDGESRRDDAAPLLARAGTGPVDWLEDGALPDAPDRADRFRARAEARVARGLALLSSARRLVTDRLHAHLLATLLGVPHVVLDNDYGKIARYLDAWPADPALVRRAATPAEAAALLA